VIIHLAGSNLGDGTWARGKKQEIVESRGQTHKNLQVTVKTIPKKPEAFISASGVGYYGMYTSDKIYTEENSPAKNDFLSRTCRKWETAAFAFQEELGLRTVVLRTAFVVSDKSEAFKKMMLLEDLCRIYLKAVQETFWGDYFGSFIDRYGTCWMINYPLKKF
jgi:NAD dependent epimerase/dehydratase family enzyme